MNRLVSQNFTIDSSTLPSRSACYDALSLIISNEHHATTAMFIVFVDELFVMLMTFCSTACNNARLMTNLLIYTFHNRKQRFYLYTRRLPSDLQDMERDVFNEKPSKEDIISVTEGQGKLFLLINILFIKEL